MNEAKHRFFCPDMDSGILDEEESGHALRVLRLTAGDKIQLIDGTGRLGTAEITGAGKKSLSFQVIHDHYEQRPAWDIHIAIAPTKNLDRFLFFLEKTTEIGITKITPVITRTSERRELKVDKLKKNLVSAIKQSGNLFLPALDEPVNLDSFLKNLPASSGGRFIAHCQPDDQKSELRKHVLPHKKVVILIGPEGDFTSEEVNLAKQTGFLPVSLGESRLRTETAGIVACHIVHVISL